MATTSLYEKYRPRTWGELIAQPKLIAKVEALRPRGLGGRAYWIAGPSGAGKTSASRLLAAEVAAPHAVIEVDASEITPADVRDWQKRFRGKPLGSNGWAVVVSEAHGLRKDTIRALLVALEDIPDYVLWAFSTTVEGHESLFEDAIDAHPLLSRCVELPLARRGLAEAFAQRAREIAQAEGLDGKPIESYVRLLRDRKNNLRAALQAIEAGWGMTADSE